MSVAKKMEAQKYTREYNGTTLTIIEVDGGWSCSNGYTYSSLSAASRDIAGNRTGPGWWSTQDKKPATRKPAQRVERPVKNAAPPAAAAAEAKPAPAPSAPAKAAASEPDAVVRGALQQVQKIAQLTQDLEKAKHALREALQAHIAKLG